LRDKWAAHEAPAELGENPAQWGATRRMGNILLTGGTGQLGHALRPGLETLGDVLAPLRDEFDLARPERLAETLEILRPKLIVNCAAYNDVEAAETEPDLAHAINGAAPAAIGRWAAGSGADVLHISTDYVFGDGDSRARTELDRPAPLNAYGRSKLAGEQGLLAAGCQALVVRTSWLYSPHGRNFLLTMLRLGREREVLSVVDDQVGAPTPARWLAETLLAMIRPGDPDPRLGSTGLLHAACAGEVSWHGFARAIFDEVEMRDWPLALRRLDPIDAATHGGRARRPVNSRLDTSRLSQTFGIVPPPWRAALIDTLARMSPGTVD